MDNRADTGRFYDQIGKLSIWLAFGGLLVYMMMFPSGIYYGFFCGVMAVTCAMMAKRGMRSAGTTIAAVVGIIDIGLSLMAFYGMYVIYTSITDPVYGQRVTQAITEMLADYGVSAETFAMLMGQ